MNLQVQRRPWRETERRAARCAERIVAWLPERERWAVLNADDRVAHDHGCPRQQIGGAHPLHLRDARRNREVLRLLKGVRAERVLAPHRDDKIRWSELPLLRRSHLGELLVEVTGPVARRSPGRPRDDHVDVACAHRMHPLDGGASRVHRPRRHAAARQLVANRFGPGDRFLVSHERHRRNAAVDMAAPTVVAEQREDVTIVVVLRRHRFVRVPCSDAERNEKRRRPERDRPNCAEVCL